MSKGSKSLRCDERRWDQWEKCQAQPIRLVKAQIPRPQQEVLTHKRVRECRLLEMIFSVTNVNSLAIYLTRGCDDIFWVTTAVQPYKTEGILFLSVLKTAIYCKLIRSAK